MRPRDLARELGFNEVQPRVSKYSDSQPRVPAGNGRASGQWAGGQGATAGGEDAPLVEGRSASVAVVRHHESGINRDRELPKDAVVVTRPDGSTIYDPDSTTGKLMAPPRANFQEIYAAGQQISNLPPLQQYHPAGAALRHFGTYDFQRIRRPIRSLRHI